MCFSATKCFAPTELESCSVPSRSINIWSRWDRSQPRPKILTGSLDELESQDVTRRKQVTECATTENQKLSFTAN